MGGTKKNYKKIANEKIATELMLNGYKLRENYLDPYIKKTLFCFDDSPGINREIEKIKKRYRIYSFSGEKKIKNGIRNTPKKVAPKGIHGLG